MVLYKLNHRVLAITQRISGVVSMGLPPQVLSQQLEELHKEMTMTVKLLNDLLARE